MKLYILVGYIPYSIDNEVKIIGVYVSEEEAEKGWVTYCEEEDKDNLLGEYDIEEHDIEILSKEEKELLILIKDHKIKIIKDLDYWLEQSDKEKQTNEYILRDLKSKWIKELDKLIKKIKEKV